MGFDFFLETPLFIAAMRWVPLVGDSAFAEDGGNITESRGRRQEKKADGNRSNLARRGCFGQGKFQRDIRITEGPNNPCRKNSSFSTKMTKQIENNHHCRTGKERYYKVSDGDTVVVSCKDD